MYTTCLSFNMKYFMQLSRFVEYHCRKAEIPLRQHNNTNAYPWLTGRGSIQGNRLSLVERWTLTVNILKPVAYNAVAYRMLPLVEPVESHLAFSTMLHAACCRNVASVVYRLNQYTFEYCFPHSASVSLQPTLESWPTL